MIPVDRFKVRIFLCLLFLTALCATPGYGQALETAQVEGQVTDPTGGIVANAEVKITEVEKGITHTAATGSTGRYVLPNLPAGPYTLEVTAPGFKSYVQTGIVLQVGQNVQVNATLEVGAVSEKLEVTANAGMVETRDTTIANVIDGSRVLDLPLNGRQATDLILLTGASVTAPAGDMTGSKNYFSSTTISIAGGQADGTNYLLDGGSHVDTFSNVNLPFPFPDALQEFSVETSTLPARNGMHPGGVVNVVTKSGSNSFHGDLFEFLRNGDLNARNFFAATHDTLKRNQYGGTAGGKIIRDKLFFFGGFQGTRNRQNPPQTIAYVPTAAMLAGDFSAFDGPGCISNGKTRQLVNPATHQSFGNNQIPASLFNPASLKLVGYLPTNLIQNACGKVVYGIPNISNEAQYIGRIDYQRSDRHTIFGRYFLADYTNPPNWNAQNILVTAQSGNYERAQTVTLGDIFTFSATAVNSFHATFSRRRDNRGPNPNDINPTQLGVAVTPYAPDFMQITTTNYFNVGCGTCAPGFFNVNTYQVADDFDLIRGKHQLAFGVEFVRTQNNLSSEHFGNGEFVFSGSGAASTGDAMADFLLGIMTGNPAFAFSKAQVQALRESIPGLYIQDTYHLNSRLTINAGLRWEPLLFPKDIYGRGSVFSMAGFLAGQKSSVFTNAPAGSLYYGDPGVSKSFTNNKLGNFAPRLGLVWNPHGDGKQTIRVGGAILYDTGMVYYSERVMTNPPFVDDIDLTTAGPFNNPWLGYPGGNPFPIPSPPPKNVTFPTSAAYVALPPNIKPMYMTQYNASYQRQLGRDWLATISYLGNKTTHVWLSQDLNYSLYIPGASSTANTAQRRVLSLLNPSQGQYYSTVYTTDDGGTSSYNAMLLSVQHRFSRDYTLLANYTWSHCISDGDFNGDITIAYYQNPTNRNADRGDCNYDYRQLVNTSIVAESPFKGRNWRARLLGNWQLSPSLHMQSGMPLNILSGKDNSLSGEGVDRVDAVPGMSPYTTTWGPQLQVLNPTAFMSNPTGTFGTLGRDVLRGPGVITVNAALVRLFNITERIRLEARFEAFNAINHTNFSAPSVTFTSATFGRITAAGDPRILQFAMKLLF